MTILSGRETKARTFFDRLSQVCRRFRDFVSRQKEHLSIAVVSAGAPVEICFSGFSATFAFLYGETSWVNRNERKRATVKKYAALRAELKQRRTMPGSPTPRDASPMRVVNRCQVTGRRRAFIRRFKISRLTFRELASSGLIPGGHQV